MQNMITLKYPMHDILIFMDKIFTYPHLLWMSSFIVSN